MFDHLKITDETINDVMRLYENNKTLIDSISKEINDEYFKAVKAFNKKGVTDSSVNSALALICFYRLGTKRAPKPDFIPVPIRSKFFF